MTFDAPCEADQLAPIGQRRTFLEVLNQVLGEMHPGLGARLVVREGCLVIFVINSADNSRKVEVGCAFDADEGWTFTWAASGQIIGPVQDTDGVANVIAHHAGRDSGSVLMDIEIKEELRLAVEVVRAAYQEAMVKHGLLPSTVELIHTYADENLAALDGEENP